MIRARFGTFTWRVNNEKVLQTNKFREIKKEDEPFCLLYLHDLLLTAAFMTPARAQVISSQSAYNRMFMEHQKHGAKAFH